MSETSSAGTTRIAPPALAILASFGIGLAASAQPATTPADWEPHPELDPASAERVSELTSEADELRKRARFAEAVPLLEEILEIRVAQQPLWQGTEWWQTIDARWDVDTARRIASLPDVAQIELAKVDSLDSWVMSRWEELRGRERYDQFESGLRRLVELHRRYLEGDHRYVAQWLNDIGICRQYGRADYTGGERYYRESDEMRLRIYGESYAPAMWESHFNLAYLRKKLGDFSGAERLHREVIERSRNYRGTAEHHYVAMPQNQLASVLWRYGKELAAHGYLDEAREKYAEADVLLAEAIATHRKREAESEKQSTKTYHSNNLAPALVQRGLFLETLGDYAGAEPLHREALERGLANLAHSGIARALDGQGRHEEAEIHHLAALETERGSLALAALATCRLALERYPEAFANAVEVEKLERSHLRTTVQGATEHTALRYAAVRGAGLDLVLSLVDAAEVATTGARHDAWNAVVRSRALVLDEMAARHRSLIGTEDPELGLIVDRVMDAREWLAALTVEGKSADRLEAAREEKETAERELAARSAEFRRERSRADIDLEEVTAYLPPRSALLAYVRYEHHWRPDEIPFEVGGGGALGGAEDDEVLRKIAPAYLVFVAQADAGEPALVRLGDAGELDRLVSDWREQAGLPPTDARTFATGDYWAAADALQRAVWDPVADHVGDVERVFIVPDGSLHLVNFGALPVNETEYLIESGPTLHYLSAERDLVREDEAIDAGYGLLAIGDPDYDAGGLGFLAVAPRLRGGAQGQAETSPTPYRGQRSGCGDLASASFDRLPSSLQEVEAVSRIWRRGTEHAGVEPAPGDDVLTLTGAQATETDFKLSAPGHRTLHLATHGFLLGGECTSALEGQRGMTSLSSFRRKDPPPLIGENPLLLAGLALAGANERASASADEDDGILTAEEIATLDLRGVEWAVLSACDTGVGEIMSGEGVLGLRRAFEIAGAETLIMSLWPVSDRATRVWMESLYRERFERGQTTPEAVRAASLEVLSDRRRLEVSDHPFFWASFVAAGGWQ